MSGRIPSIHEIEYNVFCGYVSKVAGWEGFQRRDVSKTPLMQLANELLGKPQPLLPGCLIDEDDISHQAGQKRLLFYAPEAGRDTFKTCLVRKCYQTIVNNLRELTCPPIVLSSDPERRPDGTSSADFDRQVYITGQSGTGLSTFVYFLLASIIDGSWLHDNDSSGGLIIPTSAHPKQDQREPISSGISTSSADTIASRSIQGFWKITRKNIHWIPVDENSQPCKVWQSDKYKSSRQGEPSLKTFWTVYESGLDLDHVTLPTYRSIVVAPLEEIESAAASSDANSPVSSRLLILPRWAAVDILLAFLWSIPKTERNSEKIIQQLLQFGPIPRVIFSHNVAEPCLSMIRHEQGKQQHEDFEPDYITLDPVTYLKSPWAKGTPFIVWWTDREVFERTLEGSGVGDILKSSNVGIQFRSKHLANTLLNDTEFHEALISADLHELIPNFNEIESTAKSHPRIAFYKAPKLKKDTLRHNDAPLTNNVPKQLGQNASKPPLSSTELSVQTATMTENEMTDEPHAPVVQQGGLESLACPNLIETQPISAETRKLDLFYPPNMVESHEVPSGPSKDPTEDMATPNKQSSIELEESTEDLLNPAADEMADETLAKNDMSSFLPASSGQNDEMTNDQCNEELEKVVEEVVEEVEFKIERAVAPTDDVKRTYELYSQEMRDERNVDCDADFDVETTSLSLISSPRKDTVTLIAGGIVEPPATVVQPSLSQRYGSGDSPVERLVQRRSLDPSALTEGTCLAEENELKFVRPTDTVQSSPCHVEISEESSGESLTPQFHYLAERIPAVIEQPVGVNNSRGAHYDRLEYTAATTQQETARLQIEERSCDYGLLIGSKRSSSFAEERLLQQDISILEAQKEKAAREVRVCEAALVTMKRKLSELMAQQTAAAAAENVKRCRVSSAKD